MTLHVHGLKGISFETAIIVCCRRREGSVEDITEALWGSKVVPVTISERNKKAYINIEAWGNRPLHNALVNIAPALVPMHPPGISHQDF